MLFVIVIKHGRGEVLEYKERLLIKKCCKGNVKAFEELIINYEKKVYNISLSILKNPDDAMDASQEALIKVFQGIEKFNFQSSFSTWLYRVVTNTCIDYIRKNSNNVFYIDDTIKTDDGVIYREISDESFTPEELLDKKLIKELVHESIDKLDDIYRIVIILRDIQGFSYDDISIILDLSIGTVKSRISRGRIYLKKIILDELEQNKSYNV